ncbi:hypothetical protein NA57DRAFT_75167 [Rhizodiscina lignyota]|uniref:Uncharacterized protein n=1 Tax=Rhizodiscina lignyota TaxID=1504668 RepID=A0A9P4II40_9PEZI|nr:hypothetical protein NA57DRAFT_75167 [Rhizodiscina lignyota]
MALAVHLQGPVIARAVQLGVPCFLTSDPWFGYFDGLKPDSQTGVLAQKMMHELMFWSDLTSKIRELRSNRFPDTEARSLLQRLYAIKKQLDWLESVVQGMLDSGLHTTQVKAARPNSPFKNAIHYHLHWTATVFMMHAGFALIVNRMIRVVGQSLMYDSNLDFAAPIDQYNDSLVHRICQSHDYAWRRRPIGVQYMSVPLTMAFMHAKSEAMNEWIVGALNDMDEHRMLEKPRFTSRTVEHLAKLYTGEVGPLIPPSGK